MDLNAVAFLRTIMPDGGWYAAFTKISEERKYNRFFATVDELAAHIASEDARGATVYHACASFNEPINRTASNAWGAKSLWLDIDAGKHNSPYATAVDAVQAVFNFTKSVSLPPPLCVGSGYGIHCYWPLAGSLAPGDWLELAGGLKAATVKFGLHADPSRTTDLASVLRTPGTHNRKLSEIRPVVVGPVVGAWPYDPEHFDHLLAYGDMGRSAPVRRADIDPVIAPLTQALIVEPDYAPVHADEIASQCAQVGWLRDAKGCTPEPHWYAVLGVLSRCVDGEEKAHEWSSGHQQYSQKETADKLARTRALTGATTCAKFESVNFRHCQGCPFKGKITSPISLRGTANTANQPQQLQLFEAPLPEVAGADAAPDDHSTLPLLPEPFNWSADSKLICNLEKGQERVDVVLSRFPLYLAGVGIGEVRGDRFSLHFRQWLPNRGWFDIYIAAGKLFGPGGISELAERGATIHDQKLFMNYVRVATDNFHAFKRLNMQYDQCGWKEDYAAFLVGDALYTAEGVLENVTVSQELHTRAQWLGPQQGTLEGWSGAANALFAAGCEPQSFALACAFAAPLMRLQATDEGGAVVNLLSRGSGTGKTTALSAVYTAWGQQQGLSLTKIDTRVAKAITLGVLGNLPVVYDELGNRDPQIIREFIDMFTSGRDKMRGTADGSIQHTQAGWQTLMVTGSNISIHDILAQTGGSDALAYRVLEYRCELPENVAPAKGDRLRKDMQANAGWAGDEYINYLMQPGVMGWVQENLTARTAMLWDRAGNRPEHRFWMRAIGAVEVASTLVNQLGILQFNPKRIVEWAMANLEGTNAPLRTESNVQESLGLFGEFLAGMHDTVLVMQSAFKQGTRTKILPVTIPRRAVYMRYELEGRKLYISDKILRQWLLEKEIGSREFIEDLERVDLVRNRRKYVTLTAGTDIVGSQLACVEIDGNHPAVSGTLASTVAGVAPMIGMQQDNQPAVA